ncbi:MAG: hypothetical protein NC247_14125 [Ruminococcus flavefaciens]|nr:hypothetical protein [Ruminococcus flavefaciens]MCM1362343.1 hypothetical protein [Clostridiales bacterium]
MRYANWSLEKYGNCIALHKVKKLMQGNGIGDKYVTEIIALFKRYLDV